LNWRLAFRNRRAVTGAGIEGRNSGAAGAYALGQGALRIEFDLDLAVHIHFFENLVLAYIGRQHLLDLTVGQHQPHAVVVAADVVADHGKFADAGIAQGDDQIFRNAAQPEPARHHGHSIEDHIGERARGIANNLGFQDRFSSLTVQLRM
jgi:hypothetical protein